jgi:hypothetical protein
MTFRGSIPHPMQALVRVMLSRTVIT